MFCVGVSLSFFVNRSEGTLSTGLKMMKSVIILAVSLTVACAQYQRGPAELQARVKLTGQNIDGDIRFTQLADGKVHVQGIISGLPAGNYGFHVHEKGDLSGGCATTGGHFNPLKLQHGHPDDAVRHVGDLGNVVFNESSMAQIDFVDSQIALLGPNNIIGRGVVLHAQADDFGRSNHPDSKTTGNAGARVACGVIGIADAAYSWSPNAVAPTLLSSTPMILCFVSTILLVC